MAQLVKNLPAVSETWFDPWFWKIPWRRKGYPLQYSDLENSMDCIIHGVAESDTTERLSGFFLPNTDSQVRSAEHMSDSQKHNDY